MSIPYDTFVGAFLSKITEFELLELAQEEREEAVDGYMKRAISRFKKICRVDLTTTGNDTERSFDVDIPDEDVDELVDIISDGMVAQWLKPYVNQQELLTNVMNTRDFITYSPAELNLRVGNAYKAASKEYTQLIREYSYNHGDLTDLHI